MNGLYRSYAALLVSALLPIAAGAHASLKARLPVLLPARPLTLRRRCRELHAGSFWSSKGGRGKMMKRTRRSIG